MQTDDPFATPADPATADDPFADPAPADPAAEVAAQPVEATTTATPVDAPDPNLPIVDREGAPQGDGSFNPVTQQVDTTPAAPPSDPVAEDDGETAASLPPDEPPVEAPSAPQQDPAAVPDQPGSPATQEDAPNEPQEVRESTAADVGVQVPPDQASEAPQPDAETDAANEAKVAAQPTPPQEDQPAATAQAEEQGEANGNSGAPEGLGKSPVRYYKVLYQTGEKQWTEADLKKAKDGNTSVSANIVTLEGEDSGELWLAARNNEHAVRLSWAILGTPKEGVTTMPVPKGAWKPKRIAPAPPQPERERLVIS